MRYLPKYVLIVCVCFVSNAGATSYVTQPGDRLFKILKNHGVSGDYNMMRQAAEKVFQANPDAFHRHIDFLYPNKALNLSVVMPQLEIIEKPALPKSIGTIIVRSGQIKRQNEKLVQDPVSIKSNDKVFSGDTLSTSDHSSAEIQLTDGSVYTLGPNTVLKIKDYHWSDDLVESESAKSVLQLIRGALSTITGKIGKLAPKNYKISTTTATIGVRGTKYTMRFCETNCGELFGTSLAVTQGEVVAANDSQETVIPEKQFANISSAQTTFKLTEIPRGFLDLDNNAADIKRRKTLVEKIEAFLAK